MFELPKQKVKLASVNPRAEIHGEEKKPAFDLKFEASCANDVLIYFHAELRNMLFKKNDSPDLVDQAETEEEKEALTVLRFAKLGALKWDWEGTGYTVTVDYGLGGPSDIKLSDCKVDGFRFSAQNGGSVLVLFRVICHPERDDVGRLCELIQREIEITVTAPEAKTVGELFKDAA